ncbi:MAG TPA: Ig-like domain-containing protein [Nitrosopumilaceae archaeon]|nr:Ig-like domain-containing protein [Nitrosopumilaceae archaeon]
MRHIPKISAIFVLIMIISVVGIFESKAFAYVDTTKPTISITSPSDGATIPTGNYVVTGTASDTSSGIKLVQVRINSGSIITATPKTTGDWSTWSASLQFSKSGSNTIAVKATDNAGNAKISTIHVTVNTPKPNTNTAFVFLVRNNGIDDVSLASLYSKHARSTDIVAQFTDKLLSGTITSQVHAQKSTAYFSLSDIQANVQNLHNLGYTWVVYDLEPSYSPASEVQDPVGSVQKASAYAHNNGLKLMITPADIPSSNFTGMAKYSDGFILQAMGMIAGDPTVFSKTIHDSVAKIRSGNTNSIVILQDSVNKDTVDQMNNAWDLTKDVVNGITIFYSTPDQLPQMAKVLAHVDGIS